MENRLEAIKKRLKENIIKNFGKYDNNDDITAYIVSSVNKYINAVMLRPNIATNAFLNKMDGIKDILPLGKDHKGEEVRLKNNNEGTHILIDTTASKDENLQEKIQSEVFFALSNVMFDNINNSFFSEFSKNFGEKINNGSIRISSNVLEFGNLFFKYGSNLLREALASELSSSLSNDKTHINYVDNGKYKDRAETYLRMVFDKSYKPVNNSNDSAIKYSMPLFLNQKSFEVAMENFNAHDKMFKLYIMTSCLGALYVKSNNAFDKEIRDTINETEITSCLNNGSNLPDYKLINEADTYNFHKYKKLRGKYIEPKEIKLASSVNPIIHERLKNIPQDLITYYDDGAVLKTPDGKTYAFYEDGKVINITDDSSEVTHRKAM